MARIRSLKANVTREEATEQFSSGMLDFLRETTFGPLRSVADFYIPFRLFQIEIRNGGKRDLRVFGLDAVNGSLDLYHFEQLPGERRGTLGGVINLLGGAAQLKIGSEAVEQKLGA